ncbi:hypothetical protein CAPTEDRAFT_208188 [Capitella teleta]|uniref:Exostosin GT47 domain-containing protein n=1 Tax=Capitella teleta TaxID=283909 RepID=R7V4L9_CAPTE|nr:hypothetical protein CAPTEDRAFT_208188 [Capitella teleta]|eukprot:ELU11306.1 hypothetical protein CAPTEDRAFT_208188 [Capitella teleta]
MRYRLNTLLCLAAASSALLLIRWRLRLQLPHSTTQAQRATAEEEEEAPCDSAGIKSGIPPYRIYVYELPGEYNRDIAQCFEGNECEKLGSCGYGPLIAQHGNLQVRNTWQFALEVIVHHRMLASPYRTLDINEANAFYLPYYSGLDCLCTRGCSTHSVDGVLQWLKQQQPFQERRQHLMALSKIEREHFSRRCPLLARSEIRDFLLIGIEQESNEVYRRRRRGDVRPLVVAPYPSYGHFSDKRHPHTLSQSRDVFLLLAAGTRRSNPFRAHILQQFPESTTLSPDAFLHGGRTPPGVLWYQTPECRGQHHKYTLAWMQRALFCLQPPGDSPTRKSFYDAVISGCIPVIFKDADVTVRYPFDSHLNYSAFCVEIDASAVRRDRTALDALRELVSQRNIQHMQRDLQTAAACLQYSFPFHHSPNDAFAMILNQIEVRLQNNGSVDVQPLGS